MANENPQMTNETVNEAPKPGTKDALKVEVEALKAELEAMKAKEAAAVAVNAVAPNATGPKTIKIRIPRTRADQEDVFVSVNNRTYIVKRGVEVEVPDFVAEVLRHQEEMLETIMQFEASKKK